MILATLGLRSGPCVRWVCPPDKAPWYPTGATTRPLLLCPPTAVPPRAPIPAFLPRHPNAPSQPTGLPSPARDAIHLPNVHSAQIVAARPGSHRLLRVRGRGRAAALRPKSRSARAPARSMGSDPTPPVRPRPENPSENNEDCEPAPVSVAGATPARVGRPQRPPTRLGAPHRRWRPSGRPAPPEPAAHLLNASLRLAPSKPRRPNLRVVAVALLPPQARSYPRASGRQAAGASRGILPARCRAAGRSFGPPHRGGAPARVRLAPGPLLAVSLAGRWCVHHSTGGALWRPRGTQKRARHP